jgi:hypothetical protein
MDEDKTFNPENVRILTIDPANLQGSLEYFQREISKTTADFKPGFIDRFQYIIKRQGITTDPEELRKLSRSEMQYRTTAKLIALYQELAGFIERTFSAADFQALHEVEALRQENRLLRNAINMLYQRSKNRHAAKIFTDKLRQFYDAIK